MSYLIIGSSNVARFYKRNIFRDNKPYIVQKCTRANAFELIMSETEADFIVVSVLENFLVDAVGEDVANGGNLVEQLIKDFAATLRATAERLPDTKLAVVMPMRRPAVEWYEEQLPMIKKTVATMIDELHLVKVGRIEGSLNSSQMFENDGVHLTKASGENFIGVILERAEDFFEAVSIDLTRDDSEEKQPETKRTDSDDIVNLNKTNNRVERLEAEMREVRRLRLGDQLMFARLREDADFEKNKQKEDRIVINRLKIRDAPAEYKDRIEFLKIKAAEIFEFLIPGFTGKALWVTHGRINEVTSSLSFLEAKMDSTKSAVDLRKAFVQKLRSKGLTGEYENIFITNSVTKATRVRIDILKAIARKITNDREAAYVASFISRPVLHIKKIIEGEQTFPYKSFTFVEAVTRFRNEIEDGDLAEAYERSVPFEAELEQNFIVLNPYGLRTRRPRGIGQPGYAGRGQRGAWGGRGAQGGRGGRGGPDIRVGNLVRGGQASNSNKRQMEAENSSQSTSKMMKK